MLKGWGREVTDVIIKIGVVYGRWCCVRLAKDVIKSLKMVNMLENVIRIGKLKVKYGVLYS